MDEGSRQDIIEELRGFLAHVLYEDPAKIALNADFEVLGLDSALAVEFLSAINERYGLAERLDTVYQYPDLARLAAYIGALPGVTSPLTR